MKKIHQSKDASILRKRAEEFLKSKKSNKNTQLTETEIIKLIDELHEHQIELEMQAEELKRANEQAQNSLDKYTELYDFAPSGYFSLSERGEIIQMNLIGSQMLGKERSRLINKMFSLFISEDTRSTFNAFLKKIFSSKIKVSCEVSLTMVDNLPTTVLLSGVITENGVVCNITAVDITDRKYAEKSLKDIIEKNPTSIQILNFDGYTIQTNLAHYNLFGAIVHEGYSLFNDSQLLQQGFGELFNRIKNGEVISFPDAKYNPHDVNPSFPDKPLTIKAIGFSLKGTHGKSDRVVIMHENITEQKLAENKLLQSEEKYRNLLESINDVVYEISNEGIIKYVSPSVIRVLGYTVEEVIGTNILTYIYAEDKAMIYERISKLYERDYSYLDYRYINKKGKICWVRSSTNAIIENGKMIGASGLLTDITERKLAEMALKVSEEKYSKAFITSPYAILITQPEDGKIIEVNDAFENISGYSREEALADSSIGLNLWEDIEERNSIIVQLKEGIEIIGLECKFKIKNGEIITTIFSASIIYLDGKPYILSSINDISSRKQSEDQLKISEEKYRNIFENILDVYYEATIDGTLLDISPSIESISKGQYTRNELIGKSIANFYSDPDGRNRFFSDLKKTGKVTDYELSFYNKDGSIVPIAITSGLFYDTEGNPTKIIGSMRDITNRKNAENELIKTKRLVEESERKFKEIIQSQVEGIGFININEEFEFANFASATIFETEENELVGTSLFDYLYPDEVELIKNQTQKRKSRNTNSYELKIKTKKGNDKYIHVSASPKFDENDNYVGAYGIFRDITDRKKAESALQESEAMYRAIINASPDVITITDLEGKIIMSSPKTFEMFGYDTEEEIINKSLIEFIHNSDQERVLANLLSMYNGLWGSEEYLGIKKDGTTFDIEVNGEFIKDENGQVVHLVFVTRDISERKQTEIEIKNKSAVLSNLIMNMQEGILLEDFDRKILLCNQLLCQMFGISAPPEALLGADCSESAEQNKIYFKNPEKFVIDINLILKNKQAVFNQELELIDGRFFERDYIPTYIDNEYSGHLWKYRDITERKRNHLKLEKSEERFRQVVEQSEEVVWEVDVNGLYTYVSPLAMQVYGYSQEQMIGKMHFYDLHPEQEREVNKIAAFKIFDKKESFHNFINEGVRPDGSEIIISTNGQPILDEKGILLGYRGLDIDITESLKAEKLLKESEEMFRLITEQTNDFIAIATENGIITYASSSSLQVFNLLPEEMQGRNFIEFVDEPEIPRAISLFNDSINKEQIIENTEFRMKRADGSLFFGEINGSKLQSESQIGVLVAIRDITYRKNAEIELNKSEERYRFITERSNDLIYIFRFKPEMGFEYVSPSAERITGYTVEDHYMDPMLGMKLVHPDDVHLLKSLQDGIINEEAITLRWIKKDGRIIWTESRNIPIYNENGELIAIQGKATDITERKYSEQIIQIRLRLNEYAQYHSKKEIQQKLLDELELLTDSTIGFFHSLNDDQKSLTLQCWSTNTMENMCKAEAKGQHYGLDKAGVWTDCIHLRKAIIHNDYKSLAHKKGLPEGHAVVVRELVVPVFRNKKIVAIIGIGNKTTDYHENDIEMVDLLADLTWDITERKGVEADLQKLSLAVEQSPVIIYITNLEGIIDYANPKATEVSGYSSKELIGKNPRIFSSGEKPKEEYTSLWKTINSGKEWKGEFHNKKKNGELYWVLASISPVINSNGIVSHYIAVEEDITERKMAEKKIREQNDNLNAIIGAMPDLIFVIDKNGTYTNFFSSNPESLLIPVNQIIGSNLSALFDAETVNLHLLKIEECILKKKLVTYEYDLTLNNKVCYYDARLVPLGIDQVLTSVRDITDRKEKEIELKKLSYAIEQSPVMICITDLDGNFEYANPKTSEMTGYSLDELLGQNARILKSGAKSKDEYRILWETIESGNAWYGEFRNKRKNGELIWTSASLSPIFNSSGKIMNFLAVQEDITKRKQAEAEINDLNANLEHKIKERTTQLAEINISLKNEIEERKLTQEALQWNQTLLQLMSNSSPLGFLVVDNRTDDILYFNQRFCQIWGIEKIAEQMQNGELRNNDIIPYCLPVLVDIPAFAESCKPLQEESNRIVLEDEIAFTENRTVRRFSTQIRGENDKYYGRFYIFEDITERKKAENALQQINEQLEAIISASPDGIGMVSLDGKLLLMSDKLPEMYGYSLEDKEELIGRSIFDFIDSSDHQILIQNLNNLLKDKKGVKITEYKAIKKDKTLFYIDVNSSVLRDENGNITSILFIERDISERKRIETELEESREQLNLVIKGSNDAPWDWNLVANQLTYSIKWWDQLGYSEGEISSDSDLWRKLLHPDDLENTNNIFNKALNSSNDSYEAEFRLLHKKGHYVPVLSRGFISRDTEGKAIRVTGSNMDLTERKKAEKAILDSEIKHASMISNISDVIGIMGVDGVMIYKSPNIERYFGWKPDDLIGADGWLTIHPDDLERIQSEFYHLLHTDNFSKTVEYRYKCKDGSFKQIELTATNLVNDPIINGILLNYHDITIRKSIEDALRESEKRFSLFMDYLPAFVFLKDHEGKTLFVNKYMDSAFGASKWIGKTMLEVFPNELGEKLIVDDKNSMELGYQKIEESMLQLDGKLHYYETQKFIITNQGIPPMLGGISLDITERKQAEEKILHAMEEAEKANLAKSEFLSRMSHELRTPMNSILGFAQLLEMGQLDVKQKKGVHHILQSGKHLLEMINEVLDISRIEAGYLSLLMEAIPVSAHLSYCLDIILPIAEKKNINVQFSESVNNLVCVYADSQRLKQVLLNLLNNAVKYNKNGGIVSINLNELPSKNDSISNLRISITDTGSGISSENLDKIFLPFERIGAEKTDAEGTGLGLSVVKKLMDAMKGNIGVESKLDEGSCFWIELPIIDNSLDAKKQSIENYKLTTALGIAKKEANLQSQEITDQTTALKIANIEIESQKIEKAKRVAELLIANRDLVLKNKEEVKLAAELLLAYKTIDILNDEKAKRASELVIANLEMLLQSEAKEKLESQLLETIKELSSQNENLLNATLNKTDSRQCILYIEDNVSNIELVNQILSSNRPDIRLVANKNGKKALELAIINKPALILLDLNLPDIHGNEVLQILKNDERTRDIPVVIISADAMPHQINQLKEAGSKDYLCKPLDVNTLLDVVDKWVVNKK